MWGKKEGAQRVMSLINWATVCTPKEWGGMGLIDLETQNVSLLLRWWWRPNCAPGAIWSVTVLRTRCTVVQGVYRWNTGGSFFWKALLKILPLFHYSCTRVGNELRWNWESSGLYSSKSLYRYIKAEGRTKWPFQKMWKVKTPNTVRIFCYLLLQGRILTRDVLRRRHINCPSACALCNSCQQETAFHLFFTCQYANRVWSSVTRKVGFQVEYSDSDILNTWQRTWIALSAKGNGILKFGVVIFISTCWQIWLQRNNLIFRNSVVIPEITAMRAIDIGRMWFQHC